MLIVACLKHVDLTPGATGPTDERFAGMSPADQAALELALRAGEAWCVPVTAVTFGRVAAESVLRTALAAGATEALRIDGPFNADSARVAAALAHAVVALSRTAGGTRADEARAGEARAVGVGASGHGVLVVCGDYSLDRGTGSVPALIAAELGAAQMLGLVEMTVLPTRPGEVRGLRRLDGGRRERLVAGSAESVTAVAAVSVVASVEGIARLRRAGLAAERRARIAPVTVVAAPDSPDATDHHGAVEVRPYRPRARVLAPPEGSSLDRVRQLTAAASAAAASGDPITVEPGVAAARILRQLVEWGYDRASSPILG